MKILILGANGQLGRELVVALSPLGEVIPATRDGRLVSGGSGLAIDLEAPESAAARVRNAESDVIINAAAYTAVDRAEEESELAYRVNAEAPQRIAEEAARSGALMVQFSTDYVFGRLVDARARRPWKENDPAEPLNVYGASKLSGERAIHDAGCDHLILRTSWLYAGHGQNFARTILRLAAERDELRVVDDQIGSPTWARPLAAAVASILSRPRAELERLSGTYHLAALGETTWHEYAETLVRAADESGRLSSRPKVVPVSTADFGATAMRPPYSVLDCSQAGEALGVELPPWDQSLAHFLSEVLVAP